MARPGGDHYDLVATRILEGAVIPFLGAGANFADGQVPPSFQIGSHLPSGYQLATWLAKKRRFPSRTDLELARVSQYIDAVLGEGVLYNDLHQAFNHDYPPNTLHSFLARLPAALKKSGRPPGQLIITTNYDDALERAFAGQEYDLLWYEAKRKNPYCARFLHRAPGKEPVPILSPNDYYDVSPEKRTVILMLHGAIDRKRTDSLGDSYVITEDDYIDYLSYGDILAQLPVLLSQHMCESHFLFLGYSLRDWNLRVILYRIWASQELDVKSWAVQLRQKGPSAKIEQKLWADRGEVELLYVPLEEYVAKLSAKVLAVADQHPA